MGSELTIRLSQRRGEGSYTLCGLKRCYAWRNRSEYWAEGVQCWYDINRTMDHDHNHIHTREQLKNYDHALAKIEEVLGNDPWRFISARKSWSRPPQWL